MAGPGAWVEGRGHPKHGERAGAVQLRYQSLGKKEGHPNRKASDPKEISRASMQEGDLEYDRSRIRRTNTWEVAYVGDAGGS